MNKPKRIFLAVDVENAFLSRKSGVKINYEALLSYVSRLGRITEACACAVRKNGNIDIGFLLALKRIGFTKVVARPVKQLSNGIGKADTDICLAMLVWEAAIRHQMDQVVLLSGDGDFSVLVEGLISKGIEVVVVYPEGCASPDLLVVASRFISMNDVPGVIESDVSACHPIIMNGSMQRVE